MQPETSSLQSGDRKATWTFKTSPKKVDKKTKIDKTATKAEKPPKKDLAAIEKHLKQQGSETSSLRSESRTQTEQSETSSLQSGDKEANNTTFDTSSENWSADEEEKEEVQSNNMTSSSGTPASIYTYGFQVDEKGGIMSSLDNFITTFKPMHADTKALLTVSELTGASVFIKKNGGFECLTSHETMTNDPVTMCIVKGGKWLTCEMRDISPIAPATHLDQPSPRTLHLQQNLLSVSSA